MDTARDIAAPALLENIDSSQTAHSSDDTKLAGLLSRQPLETHFDVVIETAASSYVDALDSEDQAMDKLYVQKAAQAANEAWQQTIETVSELEHPRFRFSRRKQ